MNPMPRPKQHIVLIQDDPYLVASRKAILERYGYSVEIVESVKAARRRIQQFVCDLVIVDANKAHDTALELCEEIKQSNPNLCVALMTGYHVYLHTDCPDEIIRQDEGPEGFIAKVNDLLSPTTV
jgi:DNA-binding NtrC family response regulator